MTNRVFTFAALNAAGTALYITLVATFLSNAERIFGKEDGKTVLIPIAMLLLFVLSAATTGSLVLGRPILWYVEGDKKEAISLFVATLGCLFLFMLLVFTALALSGSR